MKPFEYYSTNSIPWPGRADFTEIFIYDNGELIWRGREDMTTLSEVAAINRNNPKAVTQRIVNEEAYKEQHTKYRAEERRLYEEFKQDLFEEYRVQEHPKRENVFNLAWEHGHASGYSEVYNYFGDFVELIRD